MTGEKSAYVIGFKNFTNYLAVRVICKNMLPSVDYSIAEPDKVGAPLTYCTAKRIHTRVGYVVSFLS